MKGGRNAHTQPCPVNIIRESQVLKNIFATEIDTEPQGQVPATNHPRAGIQSESSPEERYQKFVSESKVGKDPVLFQPRGRQNKHAPLRNRPTPLNQWREVATDGVPPGAASPHCHADPEAGEASQLREEEASRPQSQLGEGTTSIAPSGEQEGTICVHAPPPQDL